MIKIREARFAGSFYPSDPDELIKLIKELINHKFGPKFIKEEEFYGAIVPHAGYVYSGTTAAWVYSRIKKANYVIIGPNHYGLGSPFAILKEGLWKTPLGEILIDTKFASCLLKCRWIELDAIPHESEHSIEVQLPFLQFRFGNDFRFVPISVLHPFPSEEFFNQCIEVGKFIADCIKKASERWILLASSDFSHYIPHKKAKEADTKLIKFIEKMDERKFYENLVKLNASVCGFGPILIAISCCKELGAKKGKLLCYKTSGDITGDKSSVVGYASIIFV